jgi:hypothetical protein
MTVVNTIGRQLVLALVGLAGLSWTSNPNAKEIVARSTANAKASWNDFPRYSYVVREVVAHGNNATVTTYEVRMIDGSPYNNVVAINNTLVPLERQQQKIREEIEHRQKESPGERRERLAKYQRERQQDIALLTEMINAFDFTLLGNETVNGHTCYVLDASPRPGYRPVSRETRVLTGMKGKMWVDADRFQWVRVQAEVFRPVSFGLFIASVRPGTQFMLEMSPIAGDIWMPNHFSVHVKSNVVFWPHELIEDDYYSNYFSSFDQGAQAHESPSKTGF